MDGQPPPQVLRIPQGTFYVTKHDLCVSVLPDMPNLPDAPGLMEFSAYKSYTTGTYAIYLTCPFGVMDLVFVDNKFGLCLDAAWERCRLYRAWCNQNPQASEPPIRVSLETS